MIRSGGEPEVDPDHQLAEDMGRFYDDPLGFVMYAYPWDTDPSLQLVKLKEPWSLIYDSEYGPDEWACEMLDSIGEQVKQRGFDGLNAVDPILESVISGHGVGKSAMTGWLVNWIMSTRPNAQGTVTANTSAQLETKTWAQIVKWTRLCITEHWFEINTGRGSMKMYHKEAPEKWFCTAQTCKEENSESFAGQHAADSTSFYIFDEASAVPDKIWEVAEGGTTDGEPMWFVFGNPTRNAGRFKETTTRYKHRWNSRHVDSRSVQITNKKKIQEWVHDYGENSDFVRVRVRGLFPSASSLQYIPGDILHAAQTGEPVSIPEDPLVMSLDVSRGGDDQTVIRFRRGMDGRTIPPKRIPGSEARDSARIIAYVCELYDRHQPDAFFMDATGLGGPIADRLRQLGYRVIPITFSNASPIATQANMRMHIYANLLQAFQEGFKIEADPNLEAEIAAIEFTHDRSDRLMLMPKDIYKKEHGHSPDDADALALLFAQPVNKTEPQGARGRGPGGVSKSDRRTYNPYDLN